VIRLGLGPLTVKLYEVLQIMPHILALLGFVMVKGIICAEVSVTIVDVLPFMELRSSEYRMS
jgi:hypothetical protein